MKKHRHLIERFKNKKGVSTILIALLLLVFIGFTAMAIDIGYILVTRNELQNISDSASLAAARQLGVIYETMSYEDQQSYVLEPAPIISVAQEVSLKNVAAGENIKINVEDVIIGRWDAETKTFTPTLNQPDAVRVIARRDSSANGPIATFFAKVLGLYAIDVSADAIAALTAQITGCPYLPVGISKAWFEDKEVFCNQPIKFYPTNTPEGCAGWNTFTESPPNAALLKNILNGLKDGTYPCPETAANNTIFNFIGGTVASAFDDIKNLFDAMKVLNDGVIDSDENPDTWTTAVVVYDWSDCSNPNKSIQIVGFATVTITEILVTPEKTINAKVICDNVNPGRGGGSPYGSKGSIPGLVE